MIEDHVQWFWEVGQVESVLPWMHAIPDSLRRGRTRLTLTEAALLLLAGRSDACASTLQDLENDGTLTDAEQIVTDALVVALIELAPPGPTVIARSERALAAISSVEPGAFPIVLHATDRASSECLLNMCSSKVRLHAGAPHALRDALAAERTPMSTSAVYRVHATAMSGLISAFAHDAEAEDAAERAVALAAEALGPRHPAAGTAELARAIALRDRGRLDLAAEILDEELTRQSRWLRWPLATLVASERALVDLARGAPRDALRRLDVAAKLTATP